MPKKLGPVWIVCMVLTTMLVLQSYAPVFGAAAAEEGELVFLEDYESIGEGERPTYGSSNWTGDNGTAGYTVGVVQEENNKCLKIASVGKGTTISTSLVIYRNLNVKEGETHTFYTSLKTTDDNRYKRLFIRNSNGSTTDFVRFQNGRLTIAGENMGRLEKNRWYEIKVMIDGTAKKATLYVDGQRKAVIYLKSYELTNCSIRADVVGEGTEGAETALYLDNTAYTKGDYTVTFAAPENTPQPSTGESIEGTAEPTPTASSVNLPEDTLLLCQDNTGGFMGNQQITMNAKPVNKSGALMLPIRSLTELLGGGVSWDTETATARVVYGETVVTLQDGAYPVVNGVEETEKALIIKDTMYVSVDTAAALFGREITTTSNGAILITPKGQTVNSTVVSNAITTLVYSRPGAEQILQDFQSHSAGAHPRILVDGNRLEKIRGWIQTDENFQTWYARIKKLADNQLNEPVCTYELRDGVRLLYVSRDVYSHVVYPAFAYLIEGDERYKQRVWKELETVASFPDWHPTHFLDTAEMTLAFAIGYDWLYDAWSDSQRKTIQTAILRLGLDAAMEAYDGTAEYGTESGAYHNRVGWKNDKSNWGLVCNGGIAAGALAVMGDAESEYCAQIVELALRSIETPMSLFAPESVWTEGIGYWEYATRYMSYFFSSLTYATGTNYGYDMVPGVASTPYFPIYHTGPQGNFNFGDAGEPATNAPVLFWFAEFVQDPALNSVRLSSMERYNKTGGMDDILFYNPELSEGTTQLDYDRKFQNVETAIFCNSWESKDANYIGIHGGTVGSSHGDLDAGSFVLDAYGERWAVDYGSDDYNLTDYFFWPGRGDYYRKRAEGHSTLVINPDSGLDQKVSSQNVITKMQSGESGGYAVLDMTPAYSNDATKAHRLIALYDDRTKFMVQDEVECGEKSDIWWLMQTKAQIEIAQDGKSAVLTQNGKHMLCLLQSSDKDAVFTYTDAVPFETSPKGTGQAKNTGRRLAVKAEGVKKLNIRVTFVPYVDGQTPDETVLSLGTIQQLTESGALRIDTPSYAKADVILADGKPIEHFVPQQFFYTLSQSWESGQPEMPQITAEADSGYEVKVETVEDTDYIRVTVTDPTGQLADGVYYVHVYRSPTTYQIPTVGTQAQIAAVSASETVEAENTPENTIDANTDTKWAANGLQWIQYDLGSAKHVTAVGLLWLTPTARTQNYSISFSADGVNWETVFDGKSAATQTGMEYFMADASNVRYVRITVNGNTAGSWTSLMETEIYTK